MQNQKQLIDHLIKNGKTNTWRELADMYGIMFELPNDTRSNKKKCDYVRRLYAKVTNEPITVKTESVSLISEFKSFISQNRTPKNIQPYLNGNPDNILVIGDTHIPYQHPDYLDFCIMLQKKWDCGTIIHIGDILDFQSTTYHTPNPDGLSPFYELEIAKLEIENWKKAFPNMTVLMGNHDRRISRKLFDNQISSQWQFSMNSVLNVDWDFKIDHEFNGIYFCHGEGPTARLTALQRQMPVVQGHRHSESYIDFPARGLFAVQTAIGIDRKALAFEYAKADPKEYVIGATIILNSKTPIIEKML